MSCGVTELANTLDICCRNNCFSWEVKCSVSKNRRRRWDLSSAASSAAAAARNRNRKQSQLIRYFCSYVISVVAAEKKDCSLACKCYRFMFHRADIGFSMPCCVFIRPIIYPVPDRSGDGYCFRSNLCIFLCFFVSKITRKRLNRFAWNFQGRCGVTIGRPDYIFGQFWETARCRDAQHGDGVCCAFAPQLVIIFLLFSTTYRWIKLYIKRGRFKTGKIVICRAR